jgi:integrase
MAGHVRQRRPTRNFPKGGYEARWTVVVEGGRRAWRGKTFARERDAQRHLARVQVDLERGDYIDPQLGKTSFFDVAVDWVATKPGRKVGTRLGYEAILRNHALPFLGHRPVQSISRTTIRQFTAEMESNGAAPGTIRNAIRSVVKPVLDLAVEQNMLRTNPAVGLKLAASPRSEALFLTAEEVNVLAAEIDDPYGIVVLFAAYTGLRFGEIAALRIKHLDLIRGRITVAESVSEVVGHGLIYGPTKTYQTRVVTLPTFLRMPMAAYIGPRSGRPDALVFMSATGGPLRHGNFYGRRFKPAVRRALPERLHGLRFHDLRHTCASPLINETNANPKAIQARLGHSSIQVTFDRYGHLFPGLDEQLTEKLDDVFTRSQGTPDGEVVEIGSACGTGRRLSAAKS